MMPDRIQITHQDPMATPDFRALCAELNDWIERASDLHNCEAHDLMARARAAREADPEGEPPSPSGYAYRYRSPFGGTCIRFNGGEEVNGGRPIEAVPYWFAPPPAPATPPAPEPGEVEDVAQWLHAHALDCRVLGRDVLGNDWAEQCTRAATLLQQQCAPPAPAEAGSGLTRQSAIHGFRSQLTKEASSRYGLTCQDAEFDAFTSGASWAWATYATAIAGGFGQAPQAGEVEEVDPDHANRLGTIIPSDIKQLADQLDRDGLRLIEVGYANESLPTRDTGLRVVRASYILQQQQAELATLKDDGWAKAMTDLVDQIGGEGPYLWEWGASIPTPKKVVEYLREHIDYLEHLSRVQGALTALKVDPAAESEKPWEREGWCNEKGDFWAERINREGIAEWEQANRNHLGNWMVRCLPHNAIPLPAPHAGEVEA